MKLLLVDDHQMVRLGLKSYFELQEDVEVVGEATESPQLDSFVPILSVANARVEYANLFGLSPK